jgi:hypothetical protein
MKTVNESEANYWSKQIDDKELNALADAGDKLIEPEPDIHPEVARRLAENPALKALIDKRVLIPFSSANGMFETYVYCDPETKEWYLHAATWQFTDLFVREAFAEGKLLSFGSGIYLIPLFFHLQSVNAQLKAFDYLTEANEKLPILSCLLGVRVSRLGDPNPFMGWVSFLSDLYQKLATFTPPAPKEIVTPEKVTTAPKDSFLEEWNHFLLGDLKTKNPSYYAFAKFVYFRIVPGLFLLGLAALVINWILAFPLFGIIALTILSVFLGFLFF